MYGISEAIADAPTRAFIRHLVLEAARKMKLPVTFMFFTVFVCCCDALARFVYKINDEQHVVVLSVDSRRVFASCPFHLLLMLLVLYSLQYSPVQEWVYYHYWVKWWSAWSSSGMEVWIEKCIRWSWTTDQLHWCECCDIIMLFVLLLFQ